MPKFNNGDLVIPKKVSNIHQTKTHYRYSYNSLMAELMEAGKPMSCLVLTDTMVRVGDFNWHPDDLELFEIQLENK